jgi:serine/threonine-protein phosphatase 4 regulatory subunit 1
MIRDALRDPFAAVRDAATYAIPTTYTILGEGGNEDVARGFRDMLLDMGDSSSYRQRVT